MTDIENYISSCFIDNKNTNIPDLSIILWDKFTMQEIQEFKDKWQPKIIVSLEIWDSIINFIRNQNLIK